MVSITWRQALGWRMDRHLLDPLGDLSAVDVVRRLSAVQAQVASAAELAINLRQAQPERGGVAAALADGRLVKTWAMRGTLHVLAPDDAGAFLALLAAGRLWERPSWVRAFGVRPEQWPTFRAVVADALADGPLTRDQLVAAVGARSDLSHLADELRSGWGTLLKPIAWHGELAFGPSDGNRVTFVRPDLASRSWRAVADADEAAPVAVSRYLAAYGPASADTFSAWLSRGWLRKTLVRRWFEAAAADLATVDVEGEPLFVRREDVDAIAAARPSTAVRLLGGFDQYVLGPGTDEPHVIAPARRTAVSRTAGWIAPVVVANGAVAGTWGQERDRVTIEWFAEAGRAPVRELEAETERLASILGRPLASDVRTVP